MLKKKAECVQVVYTLRKGKAPDRSTETFRLPTEAEWEYACRAGTTTAYYFGDSSANVSDHAWWDQNADNLEEPYAHAVPQLIPNDFGLYDMNGNVWEWCEDCYAPCCFECIGQ